MNMQATASPVSTDFIRTLDPISQLPKELQDKILDHAEVLTYSAKQIIFKQGESEDFDYYLVEGKVNLIDHGMVVKQIGHPGGSSMYRIDPRQPHPYAASVISNAQVLKLQRGFSETLTNAHTGTAPRCEMQVDEIDTAETGNWMVRMLQSKAFSNVPSTNLQQLFMRLESFPVQQGQTIITQGDAGDYYYIVQAGKCSVIRSPRGGMAPFKFATLGPGDTFGEQALITGQPRCATVEMASRGHLMRLKKEDFDTLVMTPLLHSVDEAKADGLVAQGAKWLNMRADSGSGNNMQHSQQVDILTLRGRINELDKDATYIVCGKLLADTQLGAFLLSEQGIKAFYLMTAQQPVATKPAATLPKQTRQPRPAASPSATNSKAPANTDLEKQIHARIAAEFELKQKKLEQQFDERLKKHNSMAAQQLQKKTGEIESAYKKRLVEHEKNLAPQSRKDTELALEDPA